MQQVNNAGNDIHMIGIAAYDDVNIKNIEQRVKDLLKLNTTLHLRTMRQ